MGYLYHHAIIVTAWDQKYAAVWHARATGIFGMKHVSQLGEPLMNGQTSFCVWPDGSKEGWEDSDAGDVNREKFVAMLRERSNASGEYCDWIEVGFGGDSHTATVISHGDDE